MKTIGFKIGQVTATLAAIGTIALWLIFLFANPYDNPAQVTDSVLIVILMLILSTLAVLASLTGRPYWMAFLAAIMLVPVGLYTLGTPGLFRWIGILEIIFLAAALLMIASKILQQPRAGNEIQS